MLKLIFLFGVLCWNILTCYSSNMIGPGKWHILKMEKRGSDLDEVEFNLSQRKLNRTHDCFQGSMKFSKDLDDQYGARIDICKFVDGGCKQYQVLSDESFAGMVVTYAEENFMAMLKTAGVDEPKFPVPAGDYTIKNFTFNFDELPPEATYGTFGAEACCMKGPAPVGCLALMLEFREESEDDEDDE